MLFILEYNLNPKQTKIIHLFSIVLLTFIAAFRYQIGWDYDSYVAIFDNVDNYTNIEETLKFIIAYLKDYGFQYQSIFVVYALLTYPILYMALKYNNKTSFMMSIILFWFIPGLYFNSLSIIRQFAALSICFFSARYIYKKQFIKFFLCLILATSFHYTAIIMLPFYFFAQKDYPRYAHFLAIVIACVIFQFNIISNLLSYIDFPYAEYLFTQPQTVNYGLTLIMEFIIWGTIVLLKNKIIKTKEDKINLNMFTFYYILFLLTYFSESISRITIYFGVFKILVIPNLMNIGKSKSIRLLIGLFILVLYFAIFINFLDVLSTIHYRGGSPGNINYDLNFDVF